MRAANYVETVDRYLDEVRDLADDMRAETERHNRLVEMDAFRLQADPTQTYTDGLPGRPWFRHTIYAPGFYTGYGVKTLLGIREAIEQREWELVEPQMERLARALERVAELMRQAAGGTVS